MQVEIIGGAADRDYLMLDAGGAVRGRFRWDGARPWQSPPGVASVVPDDGRKPAPPPDPRTITALAFFDRFGAKQGAIAQAAMTSPAVLLLMTRAAAASEVNLDAEEVRQGVAALEAARVITAAEAAAVLA